MGEIKPKVSAQRLRELVDALGCIGEQPDGGLNRFVYDDAWRAATALVAAWMHEAGLQVRTDAVGNVFGRLEGADGYGTVLTGSHIDTVRSGGKYDGALGILTGLAALEALNRDGFRPQRALELVALCEEEGSRFAGNFLGSRAMFGAIAEAELATMCDAQGISLATAMAEVGLSPDFEAIASAERGDVEAFVELHIEQGRVLYEAQDQIGIVSAIVGLRWLDLTVSGRADHAGATPMDLRRDAMQGAAEITRAITTMVEAEGRPAVVTSGSWNVMPGGVNIIPELVKFSVDLRHPDDATLGRLVTQINEKARAIGLARDLEVRVETRKNVAPAHMDSDIQQIIERAAGEHGADAHALPSGAGHDSQMWAMRVPTAMIFVPSVDGRSHCPQEYTTDVDCAVGAAVLASTLRDLAA
jgi:allantoate deiminase